MPIAVQVNNEQGERRFSWTGQELEKIVDTDIAEFEEWYFNHVEDGVPQLAKSERAIIKTYLWWKTHPGEEPSGT